MDNRFYFGFNTSEERKKRRKAELYSMSEQVSTFFWDEAPQHGLEMREGQQDMSFEIVDALINDQHFAIEAGVGIGKSFGYLVPVLLTGNPVNALGKGIQSGNGVSIVINSKFIRCVPPFSLLVWINNGGSQSQPPGSSACTHAGISGIIRCK